MAIGDIRHKGILFGDDEWATAVDKSGPYKGKKGMMMMKYLVKPSNDLVEAYPDILKDPFLEKTSTSLGNAIWMEYPFDWIDDPNTSQRNAIIRIRCTFDGQETFYTDNVKKFKAQIEHLSENLDIFRIANSSMREMLKNLLDDNLIIAQKQAELHDTMKGKGTPAADDTNPQNQEVI